MQRGRCNRINQEQERRIEIKNDDPMVINDPQSQQMANKQ